MNFQYPWVLAAIVPVAAAYAVYLRSRAGAGAKRNFLLIILAVCSLIVALSRPYWRMAPRTQMVKGVDLIILLDVSQSMFCEDGSPRRIDQARNFLRHLLPRFAGSSAGLIYFAGDAQIGTPLTPDLRAVQLFLESVSPAMTGTPGTRSASLDSTLLELLGPEPAPSAITRRRLALLFSDGEFFDGTGGIAGAISSRSDVSLITLACGTRKSAVPNFDLTGMHPEAFSTPNPESLRKLAAETNGMSFVLSSSPSNLIEKQIMQNAQDILTRGKPAPDYRPMPFVWTALILILIYQLSPAVPLLWKLRRIRFAAITLAALYSLSMTATDSRLKLYQEALKDATSGKQEQAIRKLTQLKQEGASEEADVAIGNIYFAQQKFDQAIEHYRSAIERNPANSRARWNWEVALKRQQNPNEKQDQPPPPAQPPPQMPEETAALLNYFDQQEAELMKQGNAKNKKQEFAW